MSRPESVKLPIHATSAKVLREHLARFITCTITIDMKTHFPFHLPSDFIFEDLGGVRSRSRTPKSERRGRFSALWAAELCGVSGRESIRFG